MNNYFNVTYRASEDDGTTVQEINMNWEIKGPRDYAAIQTIQFNIDTWLAAMGLELKVKEIDDDQ